MASAPPAAAADAPAPKGKKKLVIIIAAVLLLVIIGGGAAVFMLKKKPPAEGEEGAEEVQAPVAPAAPKFDPKKPPVFLPLEPFTVNLADRDADRFAQIGITLEMMDAPSGEQIKVFMPAVRSNVLMLLSHKTSAELLSREGKEKLARDVLRAAVLPMGIELEDEDEEAEAEATPKKKKKKRRPAVVSPVTAVHFSTFIIQ